MQKIAKFDAAPSDPAVLARLQESLERSSPPLTEEQKRESIAQAASETAAHLRDPLYYIMQANNYDRIRQTLLATWSELPFEVRMGLREMAMHIVRYEHLFRSLSEEDQLAFIEAMEPKPQALFLFSRQHNVGLANDIGPFLERDSEVKNAPTAEAVWNTIKRLDPGMEDALRAPLDPTQFVKRDLRKTPRRSA
jgi:hypothetical protein